VNTMYSPPLRKHLRFGLWLGAIMCVVVLVLLPFATPHGGSYALFMTIWELHYIPYQVAQAVSTYEGSVEPFTLFLGIFVQWTLFGCLSSILGYGIARAVTESRAKSSDT